MNYVIFIYNHVIYDKVYTFKFIVVKTMNLLNPKNKMKKMLSSALIAMNVLLMPNSNLAQITELGSSANFTFFTSAGEIKNIGTTLVYGNIGTNIGDVTGFLPGIILGQLEIANLITAQSSTDLAVGYTFFSLSTCGLILTSTLGNGQVLLPEIYCVGTAIDFAGNLIFDANNNPNALFIIKIDGALSVAANAKVLLVNGAKYENIFWQVNGAVDLGETSQFKGNLVVNGAITLLEGAEFYGKGLTKAGAIHLNNNIINAPIAPLAIKLSKFSVVNAGIINKVYWTSLSEGDGDFYELERSTDSRSFYKIARIKSNDNNKNYQYNDALAPVGLSYYRLKMNELSGHSNYSQIVLANIKPNAEITITGYPNPVIDFLNVKMPASNETNTVVGISEFNGKSMENDAPIENAMRINMTQYPHGIYIVKFKNKSNTQTLKIIKQ